MRVRVWACGMVRVGDNTMKSYCVLRDLDTSLTVNESTLGRSYNHTKMMVIDIVMNDDSGLDKVIALDKDDVDNLIKALQKAKRRIRATALKE